MCNFCENEELMKTLRNSPDAPEINFCPACGEPYLGRPKQRIVRYNQLYFASDVKMRDIDCDEAEYIDGPNPFGMIRLFTFGSDIMEMEIKEKLADIIPSKSIDGAINAFYEAKLGAEGTPVYLYAIQADAVPRLDTPEGVLLQLVNCDIKSINLSLVRIRSLVRFALVKVHHFIDMAPSNGVYVDTKTGRILNTTEIFEDDYTKEKDIKYKEVNTRAYDIMPTPDFEKDAGNVKSVIF
jgi:hypothetical protein